MIDLIRQLRVKLQNLVVRGVIDRSGVRYQVRWFGDRVAPNREDFQSQGLHFRAPAGAECIVVCPGGETANAVLLGAHKRSAMPSATLADGEGGLHFLGTYAVYLDKNGLVHLGGGTAAADFVALAAKVATELGKISSDLTTLKAATSTGLGGVPVAGGALASAFNTSTAAVPQSHASVAATKVKAT